MNKLFTSTVLTLAAVPFLMAAPAAKKVQNQPAAAAQTQSTAKPKAHKKHVKKAAAKTNTSAPAAPAK